jgi:Tol biopolymer transport system component
MNTRTIAIAVMATLCLVIGARAQQSRQAQVDLQAAIRLEAVTGDLKAAITQYERVVAQYPRDRAVVAEALVRMAGCHQKLGDGESRKIYERVVREFGDQTGPSAVARGRLAETRAGARLVSRRVWAGPNVDSYGSVSPDGRFISYTDWSTGDLALHDVATGQDRRVTDKKDWSHQEYAIGSAISPDGRQIAYAWQLVSPQVPASDHFAEVRVIDVNGGKPRVLFRDADVRSAYVHDWTADGKSLAVVFSKRDHICEIALVSITDGARRVLKSVSSAADEPVQKVAISPDGRFVAFDLSMSRTGSPRQIHVMAINAPAQSIALTGQAIDRVLGWSSDGRYLVFASDRNGISSIWALRVTDGRPQGEAELIKSNVYPRSLELTRSGALYYAVAASGENVYVGAADFDTGKIIATPAMVPVPYVGVNEFPSWSPDGKALAYVALKNATTKSSRMSTVMIRSMDTGTVRELTPNLSYLGAPDKNRPVWAPDGTFVIVSGGETGGGRGIYRVDAATGETTALVVSSREDFNVSAHAVSADGRTLYMKRRSDDAREQVIVARGLSSGTEREIVRRERFGDVVLSRDGMWLATVAFEGTSRAALLLMPAAGGDARELLRVSDPETLGAFVAWLPDSKSLLFRKFAKGATRREPWRISIDGQGAREINLGGLLGPNPNINSDGRQFAFAAGNPSLEIWALENFLPSTRPK